MKTRAAATVLGVAVALGAAVGGVVLPHFFGSSLGQFVSHSAKTPSPRASAPPQTGPLTTSMLLRNRDLDDNGFHHKYIRDTGKGENVSLLAACGGQHESITGHAGAADLRWAEWRGWGPKSGDLHGDETIGQASTPAAASEVFGASQRVLDGCANDRSGHWHYRKPVTTTDGTLRVTIFIIVDGHGKQHGSLAIFVDRRRFGALELDTYEASDRQLSAIMMTAARRVK